MAGIAAAQSPARRAARVVTLLKRMRIRYLATFLYWAPLTFGYQLRIRTSMGCPLRASANSSGFCPMKWYGIAIFGLNPLTHCAASEGDIVYGRFIGTNATSTFLTHCASAGTHSVSPAT